MDRWGVPISTPFLITSSNAHEKWIGKRNTGSSSRMSSGVTTVIFAVVRTLIRGSTMLSTGRRRLVRSVRVSRSRHVERESEHR
jgi:hypothetical protein